MGCRFCASTLDGLERNLTPSEMLEQVYAITRHTKERVSNVVVMGTGEPLDNYDNTIRFLQRATVYPLLSWIPLAECWWSSAWHLAWNSSCHM